MIPEPYLRNWLLDTGSLTERLQSQCRHFDLQLLGQRQMQPELEEIEHILAVNPSAEGQTWQVREVVLKGNHQPWVFARSIICDALCAADFAGLGNKPLGQIIFNDKRFTRHPFQICELTPSCGINGKLKVRDDVTLWGRRSVFSFGDLCLMVAEVFLPDSPAYQQMDGISLG